MGENVKYKLGKSLKVGDTIKVWWNENLYRPDKPQNQDTITKLKSYNGSLKHLWHKGVKVAILKYNEMGMLIINDEYYEVI